MKSLLGFELYKIYRQKSIYLTLVVLLALISMTQAPNNHDDSYKYYQEWEGRLTEKKVSEAEIFYTKLQQDGGESLSKEELIRKRVYESILNADSLAKNNNAKISELNNKIQDKTNNTAYSVRLAEMEKKMRSSLDLNQYYYHASVQEIIDFINTFGLILSGALILIGLSSIFSNEYSAGVDQFLFSSKFGRKQIVTAKILASFIYILSIVLVSELYNVIRFITSVESYEWQTPIQMIFKYRESPYAFDLFGYHLTQVGIHLFAACCFAVFVLLVSALVRSSFLSFVISGFAFALPVLLETIFRLEVAWVESSLRFSFTNVMKVEDLFVKLHAVNVLGFPLLIPFAALILLMIISLAVVKLMYSVIRNREVA